MKIWYYREGGDVEKIDECSVGETRMMVAEYQSAFGCAYGQHRHGKDFVWAGLKKDTPKQKEW